MGKVLHGSATTTEVVHRAIPLREESVRSLARRYGVSPTTVQKWRKQTSAANARMGFKEPRSTVLTVEEEAIRGGWGNLHSGAEWNFCLTAARMAADQERR